MAACINGNGVMTGQTDPGPKIAGAGAGVGFNWGILLCAREPEVGQRGPAHKLLIMVRGSIHQRVKLIMNNHQGARIRQQPYYCTWHRIFSATMMEESLRGSHRHYK